MPMNDSSLSSKQKLVISGHVWTATSRAVSEAMTDLLLVLADTAKVALTEVVQEHLPDTFRLTCKAVTVARSIA